MEHVHVILVFLHQRKNCNKNTANFLHTEEFNPSVYFSSSTTLSNLHEAKFNLIQQNVTKTSHPIVHIVKGTATYIQACF